MEVGMLVLGHAAEIFMQNFDTRTVMIYAQWRYSEELGQQIFVQ